MFYENKITQDEVGNDNPYTITAYNKAVERKLTQVPLVWVQGSISHLNIRKRVVYIELSEFEEEQTSPKAKVNIMLWKREFEHYNKQFSKLTPPFQLKTDIKVSLLLQSKFYIPWGKFQPQITNINPNFTLSEFFQTKQKILNNLKQEKLLDANSLLKLSPNPLRIGLITSPNSAAYKDFTTTLINSPYSFEIFFHSCTMQGDTTEKEVLKSLDFLKKLNLDVVCLVRGGGGKTDLIYFDSENIARGIANYPIPILTGIGHEIDQSIADMVAFENLITPTDCANYLVSCLLNCSQSLKEKMLQIMNNTELFLDQETRILQNYGKNLIQNYKQQHKFENQKIKNLSVNLKISVKNTFVINQEKIRSYTKGIERGPQKQLSTQEKEWNHKKIVLQKSIKSKLELSTQEIVQKKFLIDQQHPQKILKRGFAILRNPSNQKITSFHKLNAHDSLTIEVQEGFLQTTINYKKIQNK